jgi:hypothetical protein
MKPGAAAIRRFAVPALRLARLATSYAIGGMTSFWLIERTLA